MTIPTIVCQSRGRCNICPQRQFCSLSAYKIAQPSNSMQSSNVGKQVVQSSIPDKIVEFRSTQNTQEDFEKIKEEIKKIHSSYSFLENSYHVLESKITKLLYQTEEVKEQYCLLNLKLDYIMSGGKKLPEIKITSNLEEGDKMIYILEKDPEMYNIGGNFILRFDNIKQVVENIEDKETFVKYLNKEYKIAPEFIQEEVQVYLDGDTLGVHNFSTEQLAVYEGPILEERKGLFGRRKWKETK